MAEAADDALPSERLMREQPLLLTGVVSAPGDGEPLAPFASSSAPAGPPARREYLRFAPREPRGGACAGTLRAVAVFVLSLCIMAELADLPFYLPFMLPMTDRDYDAARCAPAPSVPRACRGMEACPALHALVGFRGVKVDADPCLFLAPHAAMHALMLALVVALLRSSGDALEPLSRQLFALAAVFGAACVPVRDQVPLPGLGRPVQTAYVAAVLAAAALGLLALLCVRESRAAGPARRYATGALRGAVAAVAALLLVEPALRVFLVARGLGAGVSDTFGGYDRAAHAWVGGGGAAGRDRPGGGSGHGFYALPPPWSCALGWGLTALLTCATASGAASALRRIRWTRAERSRAISSLYCTDEELEEAEADFFNFAGA